MVLPELNSRTSKVASDGAASDTVLSAKGFGGAARSILGDEAFESSTLERSQVAGLLSTAFDVLGNRQPVDSVGGSQVARGGAGAVVAYQRLDLLG